MIAKDIRFNAGFVNHTLLNYQPVFGSFQFYFLSAFNPFHPDYAPASKDRGHIVLPLYVCPSLHKFNMKTFSSYFQTNLVTRLIFCMRHISWKHIWGVPRSRSFAKVMVKYLAYCLAHLSTKCSR